MVAPLIWAGIAIGGLVLGKEALEEVGDAADSTAQLVKWAAVAGGVYVSYRALKSAGAI